MTFKITDIYNKLFDFESETKSKKEKNLLYPVHKKLVFKEEKYSDIADWLIDHLEINENDSVLDAGCGVGYVLTKICKRFNCTGLGISLSDKEIAFAKNACRELKLDKQLSFEQKNFDDQLNNKFDVIIAIESIKHSKSVPNTIENLAHHLRNDGRIFILDDYSIDFRFKFLKKQVEKFWAVDSFYPMSLIAKKLDELDFAYEIIDFTSRVEYHRKNFTGLKVFLGFLFLQLARLFKIKYEIYSIFFAGLCLERLYKKKALKYTAVIASKRGS